MTRLEKNIYHKLISINIIYNDEIYTTFFTIYK